MPDDEETTTKAKLEPRPKRVWRRRLLWLGLFLVAFAWWINGPGFRWIAHKALVRFGMNPSAVVEGSVWSGPTLRDFEWKDPTSDTEIHGREAIIRYAPLRHLRGGLPAVLTSISLTDIQLVIDNRIPRDDSPKEARPFPLDRLPQPVIAIKNLAVTVLLPEEKSVQLQGLQLDLEPNQSGNMAWKSLALPSGSPLVDTKGALAYTETGVRLSQCHLLDKLTILEADIGVQERALTGTTSVRFHEASLNAEAVLGKNASLSLREGALPLSSLIPGNAVKGKLVQCEVSIDEMSGPWTEWGIHGDIKFSDLMVNQIPFDALSLQIQQSGDGLKADIAVVLDSQNQVNAVVTSPASAAPPDFTTMPWEIALQPELAKLSEWMTKANFPLTIASMSGNLQVQGRGRTLEDVQGSLSTGQAVVKEWHAPAVTITALTEHENYLFTLQGDEEFAVGQVRVRRDLTEYSGEVTLQSDRLAAWQPNANEESQISGAAKVVWRGNGSLRSARHDGNLAIEGFNIGPAAKGLLYQTEMKASYSDARLEVTQLEIKTEDLKLAAAASLSNNGLALSDLRLMQGEETWLQGRIEIPLAATGESPLDRFWRAEESAVIELQSVPIPVGRLVRLVGQESPVQGLVQIQAHISGRPAALSGEFVMKGQDLGLPEQGEFPSTGEVDLRLEMGNQQLKLTGNVNHTHLEPIALSAQIPFQLDQPQSLPSAPLEGTLTLPSTSLAILEDYVPSLSQVEGTLSANVRIGGTVQKPTVEGNLVLDAKDVVFKAANLPRLENTKLRLKGSPEAIVIEEGRTGFAGGQVTLSGRVLLGGDAGVSLDVGLGAKQALLTRNENMVVRANADIRVRGPLNSASVSGAIGLVESRFYQEIELLPTNKQTTSLPSSPMSVDKYYGTDVVPLRDWNLDVHITTQEPFRVRTNLAAANIVADMYLRGTGAEVYPEGFINLSDTYAQLPFSRLDLNNSFVRFSKESGFPGMLDIQGESEIRDYVTRMVVTGNANNFDYVLTSNPPLPDEEIMALLGTGTTREDLVGGGQAAASRAALLLFDKIWRKVAKKDWESPEAMREKRLTFESGNVNARNGSVMTTARLRLTDHWSITGDADLEGDFRGLLYYIFKF